MKYTVCNKNHEPYCRLLFRLTIEVFQFKILFVKNFFFHLHIIKSITFHETTFCLSSYNLTRNNNGTDSGPSCKGS